MIGRNSVVRCLRSSAILAALLVGLSAVPASGCAAMKNMTNPTSIAAMGEGANMGVVVRRSDAAKLTSAEVDRLLTATPVDEEAEWTTLALLKADVAKAELDKAAKNGNYINQPVKIMPVEVWANVLPTLTAESGKYPSLMASLSPEIAAEYADVQAKNKAFADIKAKIETLEAELDKDEKMSDADKEKKEAEVDKLEEQADAAEKVFEDAKEALVGKLKTACAKVDPEVRDRLGPVFVVLRQAVEDAKTANGMAMARYPLAIPGITSDAQSQVGVQLADVIEEKTGKRPTMSGIEPGLSLEGGEPQITINGLGKEQLGELSLSDVTSETASRTKNWFGRATTLLGTASSTAEALDYQGDVLEAVLEGLEASGWKRPAALVIEPIEQQPPAQ